MTKRRTKQKLPKIGKRFVKNQFEYNTFKVIKGLLPNKAVIEYEPEQIEYTVKATYTPDFIITFPSGKQIILETKGNGRSFDHHVRQKMIAVKDQNPEKDLRIIFYTDGKIGPKRKDGSFMRQSDWAIKHGFQFAIREIPKEWLVDE